MFLHRSFHLSQELKHGWQKTGVIKRGRCRHTDPFQVTNSDHISLFRKSHFISRLNHPSIITVLDTTGDEDLEAIVIELVKEKHCLITWNEQGHYLLLLHYK